MAENKDSNPQMSKDEQIGYHKGAISTLLAERAELLKMASITEQLINAHAQELDRLGVKLQQENSKEKK